MTRLFYGLLFLCLSLQCDAARDISNFNLDWQFCLEETPQTLKSLDTLKWKSIRVPHDWSIELPYSQNNTASSTGFLPGGIGWYKKSFSLKKLTSSESVWIEFDGIYNNSTCWINGQFLGTRPNGYSSFSYNLTPYLNKNSANNEIVVRVDRSQYADSRWYTGSGIYRNVRLVRTSKTHIPKWGVRVTTLQANSNKASIQISAGIEAGELHSKSIQYQVDIEDSQGVVVETTAQKVVLRENNRVVDILEIHKPILWNLENPYQYSAKIKLIHDGNVLDDHTIKFGIRTIQYDSNKGFSLNGKFVKFKGANLHHDAGSVGAAVPRDIWFSRIKKLKSIGCNAIRTSHNPHSPDLLDACDELGMLVIAEAFDEWNIPKDKSIVYLSDNAAPPEVSESYAIHFDSWAERDLKDLIRRDFNRPSIIMWSIGNEIEWTHRYYQKSSSYEIGDLTAEYQTTPPDFDPVKIRKRMADLLDGKEDELVKIARKLSKWVKEEDTTRWVTCGSVHPSVAFASGYADTVDVIGFNYRAVEYDGAHKHYPNAKIYGAENWASWQEWKDVENRDFVGGIFVWTGFAYMGEAGPYPRKGLNISLFDYTGIQTPRGHMFESMWKEDPKIYLGTIPLEESEYSYNKANGWTFTERQYTPEAMAWLRKWEWDYINSHWNYRTGEQILVQSYTNCEEAELFLEGKSLGTKKLSDFDDGVLKWIVPFSRGELKIVGRENGITLTHYSIHTAGEPARIQLVSDRISLANNHRDVAQVFAQLFDKNGYPVSHMEKEILFKLSPELELTAIDNGSEYYVGSHQTDKIKTYNGRAYVVVEAKTANERGSVTAQSDSIFSNQINLNTSN